MIVEHSPAESLYCLQLFLELEEEEQRSWTDLRAEKEMEKNIKQQTERLKWKPVLSECVTLC